MKAVLKKGLWIGCILMVPVVAWHYYNKPTSGRPVITVFAGAGMSDALLEIARVFEETQPYTVRFSFAASSTLARQIAAGATPDIFFSAHQKWMDFLEEKGAIQPETRHNLLGNRLVCIAPSSEEITQSDPALWLQSVAGRIAMGDPDHVPAGIYGAQALKNMGIWENVKDRLAPAADTRSALRSVALGECNAGIVYATDALSTSQVQTVSVIDDTLHEPIHFPVALCSHAGEGSHVFFRFLHSAKARDIFLDKGFSCIGEFAQASPPATLKHWGISAVALEATLVSIRVAIGSVLILLIPGILAGWSLSRFHFPGKGIVEAILHLPMVVPPVVTGYLLLLLLGKNGPVGSLLMRFFNIHLGFTFSAAMIAAAVMSFPLMVRSVRIAVELADTGLEEAAATCGAGPVWRFLSVTLPLASPGILAGMVLSFSRSLGEFGATMIFAGNIPGQTQTIPLAIYTALQQPDNEQGVFFLATLSILLSMGALWISRHVETQLWNRREV